MVTGQRLYGRNVEAVIGYVQRMSSLAVIIIMTSPVTNGHDVQNTVTSRSPLEGSRHSGYPWLHSWPTRVRLNLICGYSQHTANRMDLPAIDVHSIRPIPSTLEQFFLGLYLSIFLLNCIWRASL